ncbi:lactonase family protein [Sphingobacterium spiritivorum]|uniref:lactonase family protein n=1 Tax=Sphingobacterium spiritivorum TaxID=258 RepID=UPI001919D522|nr:lactonase family protein [Sphingobacterium spiritivorum]QQT27130.1 lactonase family protein [Sphingobacterium spiritivorum]
MNTLRTCLIPMIFLCALLIPSAGIAQTNVPLFVGTYTQPGKSKGIYIYDFNQKSRQANLLSTTFCNNPSFLAKSKDGKTLYAVSEKNDGTESLSAYHFDGKQLTFLNKVNVGGADPCHVSLSHTDPIAVVSNYSGGSFAVFRLNTDGSIASRDTLVQHSGKGADPSRQDKPHVHSAFFAPDFKSVFVQDLGTDRISIYPVKQTNGVYGVGVPSVIHTLAGGGPRHIAIAKDGKSFYLVTEMTAKVVAYAKKKDKWEVIQEVDINRAGFTGGNGAADIKLSPDGKFVYATNRGDANVITAYKVLKDGKLIVVDTYNVGGKGPRNFNFSPDGQSILIGNQSTDNVTLFKRNIAKGSLQKVEPDLNIFSPVCIVF